ncbi:Mechanosensitive ion channel [Catalinimonas alkaloidigena]|uniref:Mechanosensitive ion channel n=1 Tax=Catalinimonas alkaloidigena TaxID=1075417 RepID=A0A1G9ADY7_9BACT|nr:mechanosensitive ion channel domain-containing protein [Catalinimonas alkaloidigena]SDK24730.1 Mechanosensitive ion channel [Catalinimonas alkaloidigena]
MLTAYMDQLNALSPWLQLLFWISAALIGSLIVGLLLRWLMFRVVGYYERTYNYYLLESVIKHLRRPLAVFMPLFILALVIPATPVQALIRELPYVEFTVNKVVKVLLLLALGWLVLRILNVIQDVVFAQYSIATDNNFTARKVRTQMQFIKKLASVAVVIIISSIILMSFESVRQFGTGLLTSAGVAGIIVGFAAQKSIANLLAGFQIAFTQPIRIDDVVIAEGEWGRIEEITLTYVVVCIWDKRRLILPITYFIDHPFQNWTRVSADIMGSVFLYTDYTIPIEPLRDELTRLLESSKLWDRKVNVLQVTDSKEHTLELRALMSAATSSDAWDLRCYVRENLVNFIQKNYPECLPRTRALLARDEPRPSQNGHAHSEEISPGAEPPEKRQEG